MTYPETPEFQAFAARIADAVMLAEANGWRIGTNRSDPGCCCPIGAIFVGGKPPGSWSSTCRRFPVAYPSWGREQIGFMEAFDGVDEPVRVATPQAIALGRAYRERALRKERGL